MREILLLFTIPENEPGNQRFLRNLFRFMDRDAEGIEFAIKVPATRKPLLLILRTRFARRGEFVAPWTRSLLLLRTPGKNGLVAMARMDRWSMVFAQRRATRRGIEFAIKNPPQVADSIRLLWDAE